MKKIYIAIGIFLGAGLLTFLWVKGIYNNLVVLNEETKNGWGQVENAYQRRSDLLPNLVNTVKGAANFEKSTLREVIQARAKATSVNINAENLNQSQIDKFQAAQEGLGSSLSRLLVSVERYPELKATQNFRELQSQIEGTENRINVQRNRFNDQVRAFNAYRNQFPNMFIANFSSKFSEKGYFTSKAGAENAPEVIFD